jgi:rhodanese-related sulfurtransferase
VTFASVDELLADARSRLSRVSAAAAAARIAAGDRLVDIRPASQRACAGEVPGALVIERNHLEWRLDPRSSARVAEAVSGQRWIVLCAEGYASSLAADSLNQIGVPATDLIGGFIAWRAAGLPTLRSVSEPGCTVPG